MSPASTTRCPTSSTATTTAPTRSVRRARTRRSARLPDGDKTVSVGVRVTDGDGGADTSSVDVEVDNVAPTIGGSLPAAVDEGSGFLLSLGSVVDPGIDTVSSFTIDWGDGSPDTTGSGSPAGIDYPHTYADGPDTHTVTVSLTDEDGTYVSFSQAIDVDNVAPTITDVTAGPNPVGEALPTTVTVTATDPAGAADPLSYEFDCEGDGTYAPAQASNAFDCTFDDGPSGWTVKVRVSDGDGGSDLDTEDVTVTNRPPTGTFTTTSPVYEGSPSTLAWTAYDDPSDADDAAGLRFRFACDALVVARSTAATPPPRPVDTSTCTFFDNGTYGVGGRLLDKDNGDQTSGGSVTVLNVDPAVSAGDDETVDEGDTFSRGGSFTDPGTDTLDRDRRLRRRQRRAAAGAHRQELPAQPRLCRRAGHPHRHRHGHRRRRRLRSARPSRSPSTMSHRRSI